MESLLVLGAESAAHRRCEITHTANCVSDCVWGTGDSRKPSVTVASHRQAGNTGTAYSGADQHSCFYIYVNISEDVILNVTFKIRIPRPAEGAIVRFLCNACVSNEGTTRGSSSKQIAATRCRHGRTERNQVSQNILLWVGPNSAVRWGSYRSPLCPSLAFPLLMSLAHQTFQDGGGGDKITCSGWPTCFAARPCLCSSSAKEIVDAASQIFSAAAGLDLEWHAGYRECKRNGPRFRSY